MNYIPDNALCECGANALYMHPHIGYVCRTCLEQYFRDVLKLPNWRVC
jgi:hypothetical protein